MLLDGPRSQRFLQIISYSIACFNMFDWLRQVDVEMQDAKSVQISKPVASRPSRGFRSFPDELPTSSSASLAGKPIASKPKATRFRAASCDSAAKAVSLMEDTSATEMTRSNILVKPTAKPVSRATASILSSLGNTSDSTRQPPVTKNNQFVDQAKPNHHSSSVQHELKQTLEASNSMRQSQELDTRNQQPAGQDRQSYDGYNWRKYGQKQVKGSEYPRSYYKCTYPTCPVKKKVERSFDGQIAEIVYKGEHNHPKPQPPKRVAPAGLQEQAFAAVAVDENSRETGNLSWSSSLLEVNPKELSMAPSFSAQAQYVPHHRLIHSNYGGITNQTDSSTIQVCTVPTSAGAMDNCMPHDCKRRKNEDCPISGTNSVGETFTDPHSVIQTSAESNISGDGYHWRKYGQKVVKGNSYPRSYYKCTAPKCNVRKYTERASDNPNYIVTTYEGKHDHEMPMKRTNLVVTNTETPPS